MSSLLSKAKNLPEKPGIYLMKDERKKIIYVGKAKNLKKRVSSYFLKSEKDLKTRTLIKNIQNFSIIIVSTEEEALLLERSSIKNHKPRFNILLKDDKAYPYLEITYKETWPRVQKVRRKRSPDHIYFGPFPHGAALNSILHELHEVFPLIRCTPYEFERRKKPCHYFHMKKCLAPCVGKIKEEDYKNILKDVISILKGQDRNIEKSFLQKMKEAAAKEEYELAASYRDQVEAFKQLRKKQNITNIKEESCDIIHFANRDQVLCFSVLIVRDGYLKEKKFFTIPENILPEDEALRSFVMEYYERNDIPKKSYLPFLTEDIFEASQFIQKKKEFFKSPQIGIGKKLLELSKENAFYHLEEYLNKQHFSRHDLEEIQKTLSLKKLPKTIECLDISNLGEKATVASLVCFRNLKPSKEDYKIYHVKTISSKPDDYDSIREVVRRRLKRAREQNDLPDLFVVDGGKGQLGAALECFEKSDISCDLVSLAKDRNKEKKGEKIQTGERVFFPYKEDPLLLSPYTLTFRILTQVRDEAHRFAIGHHRKKRSKEFFHSPLLEIPGLGDKLHETLLKRFGSLEKIKEASLEDLTSVPRVTEKIAKEIKKKKS